ncbi:thioredoxin-like protein [Algoriphagus aquaeductus]|uniref:Thioredoxin-like protein n=1 Tax=Algoriphagus aquaeductus TaxID=475299 RepID=A0A326RKX4_9BACT|nr:thioredoxin family protein [Algoriphagus aquaeductus]PZV77563.1 thioredoxin-like protein [Algoriphagus aquaeductus]
MKKFLFTCFLALPCLFGSTTVLRKVAESPPEPPLHRLAVHVSPHSGDTHRGGLFSRPDTFAQLDNSAETSVEAIYTTDVSAIDGGPILRSSDIRHPTSLPSSVSACPPWRGLPSTSKLNFGLVDSYLDMGAGEEATSLQPAPVTVLAHPTPVIPHPASVIWGRISEYGDRSQIKLTIYPEYYFPSTKAPGSNLLYLPLKLGNIMEGGYPKDRSFQYNLESRNQKQWFSLSLGETSAFLDRFLIEAGDSIQVFLNLESNALVFAGPAAEKFKLQQGLALIAAEAIARTTPVLYTQNPELVLQDPEYRAQMEEAKASAGPVLEIKKRSMSELDRLANYDVYQEGGQLLESWSWIDSFTGRVPENYQAFFRKEAELSAWKQYMNKIYSHLIYASKESRDTLFIERAKEVGLHAIRKAETFLEENLDPSSAAMMDYLSAKTKLQSLIFDKDLMDVAEFIPQHYWREKYLVSHFYESYQRISQVDEQLEHWISTVENPDFRQRLIEIRDLKGSGKLVSGFEFLDDKGDLKTFEEVSQADLILVEFWITGCKACVAFNERTLAVLKEKFGEDPRFQIITVSADFNPELWKSSLESGRYTQPEFTNLYTGPRNRNHPFLVRYGISSFPNRILINREGKFVQTSQVPFLAPDLIQLIESYLEPNSSTNPTNTL